MNLIGKTMHGTLAATLSFLLAGFAASGAVAAESLGALHTGMKTAAVEQQLGKPSAIEDQPPECPGDPPVAVWSYADRGLMLVVEGSGSDATLTSVSSVGGSGPETARGIAVGATYDQVTTAYPNADDPSPESFLVDLENDALEISFSGGEPRRVTRILLTSETPMVYEEGQDCGQPVDAVKGAD